MTLLSAAERIARLDHSAVVLNSDRCLHSLFNFATCEACYSICPVEAIQPGKPPSLDTETCQTCLACLPTCPTGAFGADDAVRSLLDCTTRVEAETIELVCAQNPREDRAAQGAEAGIRVKGCLAGLGSGALLALVTLGARKFILRLDACEQCPWGKLENEIIGQIDRVHHLLPKGSDADVYALRGDEGLQERTEEQPLFDADNPPLSRRGLFQMLGRQGQLVMARTMGDENAPHERKPGREQRRLAAAIRHLAGEEHPASDLRLEGFSFATLSVSEDCTACGVCAHACPTAALIFQSFDQHFELLFSPQDCIGCEACAYLCAEEAITIHAPPSAAEVFGDEERQVLQEGSLTHCRDCMTPFKAKEGEEYCPLCNYRRENPFGSAMPPGLKALIERRKSLH